MSIPRLLESQKKICLRFLEDEGPKTGRSTFQDSQFFRKALEQQFRLDQQMNNLQDPLLYIQNEKIRRLTADVEQATQKLRQEVGTSVELSKTFYRNILLRSEENNGQKGKKQQNIFAKEHPVAEQIVINRKSIMKKKEQQNYIKSPLQIYKDSYNDVLKQRLNNTSLIHPYRHNRQQQDKNQDEEQEAQDNKQTFSDDKVDRHRFKNLQDSQIMKLWKPSKLQMEIAISSSLRIDRSKLVEKAISRIQLNLIQNEYLYGQGSNELYYDFQFNLNFEKSDEKIHELESLRGKKRKQKEPQHILQHFLDFNLQQITCNDLFNVGIRKITPYKIRDYQRYKEKMNTNQRITVNGKDMEERYAELNEQYNLIQRRNRNEKKSKGLQNKMHTVDCQTIKQFEGDFKLIQMETIEDDCLKICKKLQKINQIREQVMQKKNKKDRLVFMKNICLEVKQLLFQLLLILIKGEKFYVKEGGRMAYPMLNYREFMEAENQEEVEKKILEVVFANEENFETLEIEGVSKAKLLQMFKHERKKNEKILLILDSKINS